MQQTAKDFSYRILMLDLLEAGSHVIHHEPRMHPTCVRAGSPLQLAKDAEHIEEVCGRKAKDVPT